MNEYRDKNTGNEIQSYTYQMLNTLDYQSQKFECCDKFKRIELDFEYVNTKRCLSGREYITYYCPICGKKLDFKMLSLS